MFQAAGADRTSTQRAILAATLELMAEGGEPNVRVAEVARRAGVTTGAIYSNFESREGLIAAAHITYMQKVVEELTERRHNATSTGTPDPRFDPQWTEVRRNFFDKESRVEQRRWVEAALMAHRTEAVGTPLLEIAREALDLMAREVAEQQERGWVRSDLDPRAIAVLILGASMGAAVVAGVYTPEDPDFGDKLAAAWPDFTTAFLVDRTRPESPAD